MPTTRNASICDLYLFALGLPFIIIPGKPGEHFHKEEKQIKSRRLTVDINNKAGEGQVLLSIIKKMLEEQGVRDSHTLIFYPTSFPKFPT